MKHLLSLGLLLSTATALAMDPIRVNFNDRADYSADGWQDVSWEQASAGLEVVDGVTMKVSGSKGWLYGDAYAIVTNRLQRRYIDDGDWQNPTVASFDGLKKGFYSLKVYLSSDGSGEGAGAVTYNPIEVNGTWYHYDSDGALVTGKDRWGDTSVKDTGVGTNVLEMAQLLVVGTNLTLSASRDWGRGGFAAIELMEYDYRPTPNVLSINVANSTLTNGRVPDSRIVSGLAGGSIPGYAWLNVSEVSNSFTSVQYWNSETHQMDAGKGDIAVKVVAGGHWYDGSPSEENAFLKYYLDDNSSPSISVDNVPFKLYDVIVYQNNDWNNGSHKAFNSVNVNGVNYIWDEATGAVVQSGGEWGARGYDTAILGTNALRVASLSAASLVVSTGARYYPARGGFAALQVVSHDYADVVAAGDISTKEINALAGGKKEVVLTLPAGATLTIDKKPLRCEVIYVVSEGDVRIATWNCIEPEDKEGWYYATNYAKIDTTGVKGVAFHGWKPSRRVISLNVNSGNGAMPATWDLAGGCFAAEEMPAAAWNNLTGTTGTNEMPIVWNGNLLTTNTVDGMTVEWSGAVYGWGSSPDVFRRGWFDGSQKTGKITVTNLPFERYDVIVYENWDGGSHAYGAPWVNGVQWTHDSTSGRVVRGDARWGDNSCDAAAELNVNAIRVPDQTAATCEIKTGGYCGNICAVQIVEHCPPVRERRTGFNVIVK